MFLSHPLPGSFRFPALLDFALGLEEGSLLCPVRALSFCLCMTEGFVRRSSALFVSPSRCTRAISRNAFSFFLRGVLLGAGAVSSYEGKSVCAHSISGFHLIFFFANWSVSKVLDSSTWRHDSVFSSFLLRISLVFEGLQSSGPFMAAGSVVSPP